jgi:uncharacterized RDD family membrane protein YckC
MGQRFGGLVIDWIVTWIVAVIVTAILRGIFGDALTLHLGHYTNASGNTVVFAFSPVQNVSLFVIQLVYFGSFVGLRGATPGHLAAGLRVVDMNTGQHIGFWRAALRALVMLITGGICTLGYWSPFFDSTRRQGWHDMSARAVVIPARRRA